MFVIRRWTYFFLLSGYLSYYGAAWAEPSAEKKESSAISSPKDSLESNQKPLAPVERVPEEERALLVIEKAKGPPTSNESWYLLLAGGFGVTEYSDFYKEFIETEMSSSTNINDRLPATGDVFGFYWPLNGHRTAIGVVHNLVSEAWEDTDLNVVARITQSTLAFSAMHFYGLNIGDGWYLRADGGPSYSWVRISEVWTVPRKNELKSQSGFGFLLGGGYGIRVGGGTRLLFQVAHSVRYFEGSDYGTTSFTVGGLM